MNVVGVVDLLIELVVIESHLLLQQLYVVFHFSNFLVSICNLGFVFVCFEIEQLDRLTVGCQDLLELLPVLLGESVFQSFDLPGLGEL